MKNFFAKLARWTGGNREGWQNANVQQQIERNRQEANLAKERQSMHKQNMAQEGIIPRIDTQVSEPEKHDKAA